MWRRCPRAPPAARPAIAPDPRATCVARAGRVCVIIPPHRHASRSSKGAAMLAQVNGTELYYTTHGHGRPLLVMHGGLGLDHAYFRPWLDALGDVSELIYYDHRGNGKSARPTDWSGVTHATWADDADALREQLGHERITLYGHSYGGFLALEYALRHADHL